MPSRIPDSQPRFDHIICRGIDFLKTPDPVSGTLNGIRLGLTQQEINNLVSQRQLWRSNNTNNPGIFEKHLDPLSKGKSTTLAVKTFMKSFRAKYLPLLNRMASSPNIINNDRLILNIAIPGRKATDNTPIREQVSVASHNMGGAQIMFNVRVSHDSNRNSIHPKSQGWQIAYTIVNSHAATDEVLPLKVMRLPPARPEDCLNLELNPRSKAIIALPIECLGLELFYFVRWHNTTHPERSGPWLNRESIFIS